MYVTYAIVYELTVIDFNQLATIKVVLGQPRFRLRITPNVQFISVILRNSILSVTPPPCPDPDFMAELIDLQRIVIIECVIGLVLQIKAILKNIT